MKDWQRDSLDMLSGALAGVFVITILLLALGICLRLLGVTL